LQFLAASMTGGTRTGSGRAMATGPGGARRWWWRSRGLRGRRLGRHVRRHHRRRRRLRFTFVTAEMAVCRWGGCWMWISGIGMYGSSTLDRRGASSLGGGVFVRGGGSGLVSHDDLRHDGVRDRVRDPTRGSGDERVQEGHMQEHDGRDGQQPRRRDPMVPGKNPRAATSVRRSIISVSLKWPARRGRPRPRTRQRDDRTTLGPLVHARCRRKG
jgi:hypothetical protein